MRSLLPGLGVVVVVCVCCVTGGEPLLGVASLPPVPLSYDALLSYHYPYSERPTGGSLTLDGSRPRVSAPVMYYRRRSRREG